MFNNSFYLVKIFDRKKFLYNNLQQSVIVKKIYIYMYIWGRVITGSQDLNMRRVCKVHCAYIHISEESY